MHKKAQKGIFLHTLLANFASGFFKQTLYSLIFSHKLWLQQNSI